MHRPADHDIGLKVPVHCAIGKGPQVVPNGPGRVAAELGTWLSRLCAVCVWGVSTFGLGARGECDQNRPAVVSQMLRAD